MLRSCGNYSLPIVVITAIVETRVAGIHLRFKNEYVKNVQPNTLTEKKNTDEKHAMCYLKMAWPRGSYDVHMTIATDSHLTLLKYVNAKETLMWRASSDKLSSWENRGITFLGWHPSPLPHLRTSEGLFCNFGDHASNLQSKGHREFPLNYFISIGCAIKYSYPLTSGLQRRRVDAIAH